MRKLFESWRGYISEQEEVWLANDIIDAMSDDFGWRAASAPAHIKIAADMLFHSQTHQEASYLFTSEVINELDIGSLESVILNKNFAKEFKELVSFIESSIKELDLNINPNYDVCYYSQFSLWEFVDIMPKDKTSLVSSQDEKYSLVQIDKAKIVEIQWKNENFMKRSYKSYSEGDKVNKFRATSLFLRENDNDVYMDFADLYLNFETGADDLKKGYSKDPDRDRIRLEKLEEELNHYYIDVAEVMAYYNAIPLLGGS